MQEGPKLLVEWEPRGQGFLDSLRPAFSRKQRRLMMEVGRARRPMRPILLSYGLHLAIVIAVATAPISDQFHSREFVSPVDFHEEHYELVYVPQSSLPQMTDAGG